MKHIKRDLRLKAWGRPPWVDWGGGAEAKIQLLQRIRIYSQTCLKQAVKG